MLLWDHNNRPNAFNPPFNLPFNPQLYPPTSDPKRIDQLVCYCWACLQSGRLIACLLLKPHQRVADSPGNADRFLALSCSRSLRSRSLAPSLSFPLDSSSRRTIHRKPICYLPVEKVRSAIANAESWKPICPHHRRFNIFRLFAASHFNCRRQPSDAQQTVSASPGRRCHTNFTVAHLQRFTFRNASSISALKASEMMKRKDWRILERELQIKDWNSRYNQNKF